MKSFYKRVSFILLIFLCINFPFPISASEFEHASNNSPFYRFFSELPSIDKERKLHSDNYLAKKEGIFAVQEDIYEEERGEDLEHIEINKYSLYKKTMAEKEEIEKYSFDEESYAKEDPFTEEDDAGEDPFTEEGASEIVPVSAGIPDNVEGFNRSMFTFNDKMYFWVLKPVSQGYGFIMPEFARVGVSNFFDNLSFPVRFFNCLFQGKVKDSGVEFARFGINTTVGIVGFIDVAERISLETKDEDFDQTFAVYGFETGTYLMWPFWGPSSVRGTFAMLGDAIFNPVTYIPGGSIFRSVNKTSLRIGDYEALKDASVDPYVAIRDAYFQHRRELINK